MLPEPHSVKTVLHEEVSDVLQAVYHIPTREEAEPTKSIALALQTLFYRVSGGGARCPGCSKSAWCSNSGGVEG